jgi:hypothetical protein
MLLSTAASTGCTPPAAAPQKAHSTSSCHIGMVAGIKGTLQSIGNRPLPVATSCRNHNGVSCRRRSVRVTALPAGPPLADAADLQQVWHLAQRVWQDLQDAAASQPLSDVPAALALQHTALSAQQTLLMLYLLRSSCTAAQMSALATSAADSQRLPDLAASAAQAAQQRQTALAARAQGTSGGTAGSSKGSKGGAVRPPGATAQALAGQAQSDSSGGGGSGKVTKARRPDIGTLWGLLVLGLAYVHHSTTGVGWQPCAMPVDMCISRMMKR